MRILLISNAGIGPILTHAFNYAISKGYEVLCINGSRKEKPNHVDTFIYFQEIKGIIDFIKSFQIQSVLIISSERSIKKDGLLAEALTSLDVNLIGNSKNMMEICNDKAKTKEFLSLYKFATPKGFQLSPYMNVLEKISEYNMNFPLFLKECVSSGGYGNHIVHNYNELQLNLIKHFNNQDILIEEYVSGIECSVEVLGSSGKYHCYPPIYKGYTKPGNHSLDNHRINPYFDREVCEILQKISLDVAQKLKLSGVMEIDFVWNPKRKAPFILEINPRLSGISKLNMAYSKLDISHEMIDLLVGDWQPKDISIKRDEISIELRIKSNIPENQIKFIKSLPQYRYFISRKRVDSDGTVILYGTPGDLINLITKLKTIICKSNSILKIIKENYI